MNYIAKLKELQEKNLQGTLELEAAINDLLIYLASDKFAGVENNYVNASEMFRRVFELKQLLNN
ncbi:hypothetical protein UFOVP606_27 [uncultured Caudovirales phage]|uniref:Uncharacterized protein n=1 Tax=uncultured Caudovirales phage TaxID=2100421 RepID=A0A6J5N6G5_9CAUD|nr:hypothetical protein UFOVP606_27 [uncultured Caudovirales phage]